MSGAQWPVHRAGWRLVAIRPQVGWRSLDTLESRTFAWSLFAAGSVLISLRLQGGSARLCATCRLAEHAARLRRARALRGVSALALLPAWLASASRDSLECGVVWRAAR